MHSTLPHVRVFSIVLVSVTLFGIAVTFAATKQSSNFTPQQESLHVFPSFVSSDSWHNIATLGEQDVNEHALFQSFTKQNSAYIDPSGALPVISDTSSAPVTEAESTQQPSETIDVVETEAQASTSAETASTTYESETDNNVPEAVIEETMQEVVTETEESAQAEEETAEPLPETLPAESEPAEEEVSMNESHPIFSFFRRVTESFLFAQAVTTTPVVTSEEPLVPDQEEETDDEVSVVVEEEVENSATTTEPDVVEEQISIDEQDSATTTEQVSVLIDASTATTTATSSSSVSDTESDTEQELDTVRSKKQQYTLTLSDFGVPELASGQFVNNLQLRLSLAGQYDVDASSTIPSLSASYSFGALSGDAGIVLIEEEVSNALNGGYYLLPLPSITDPSLLSELSITLTFDGDIDRLNALYIDSAWLEVGTVVYDKALLKKRVAPDALKHLKKFSAMEFMGDTLDFSRSKSPVFSVKYNSQRNFVVRAVRSALGRDLASIKSIRFLHGNAGALPITPEVNVTPEGLISVVISEEEKKKLKPGTYTVEFEIYEGSAVFTDSFDFQWGMLSINSNQTEYRMNANASISMGALTPNGNTLCNALLDLYITDPRGYISRVPVSQSGQCHGNNVIDVPDYSAQFVTSGVGEYEMYMERLDEKGNVIGHTTDTFFVVGNQDVALERNGPTRIYPPAPYAMELSVHAERSSFEGELVERVPADFEVFNTDAEIFDRGEYFELVWDLSLLASTTETVSYEFDAPDLSPYLYELGPAELIEKKGKKQVATSSSTASSSDPVVSNGKSNNSFREHRQWQIASDATGNMILYWDNATAIPTDWSCLSCGSGTFYQRFGVGSSTYNSTGGSASHTPTGTGSVVTSASAGTENFSGTTIAGVSHTHTLAPVLSSTSSLPAYRQLRVIQYTASAGEPANIPTGAIGIFDVASSSLPSGWNRYSAQDGYFVRGEDTPGTTGGSNNHVHNITGTTAGAAGSTVGNRGGGTPGNGAAAGHTHTVTSATAQVNNEPPYIEVLLAQISATATAPNNLIAMWTEDTPSGWLDVSSSGGDPFNNRFIKASTTYGATGGATTHAHANVTGITSSGPSGSAVVGRSGSTGSAFAHTHSVSVSSISTNSSLPPYVSVVFGKRQGTNPVYAQESFRWYVNEDAQTPTDPWPVGGTDLSEGVALGTSTTLVKNDDVIRLRVNTSVSNATATAGARFKLQYAPTANCSAGSWTDVGTTASSTVWRGYNNGSVTDHGTLSTTVLASSTVSETYEENGYATGTPNEITTADYGEWDFVLEHNGALAGTNYCFRLVEEDETVFGSYISYAQLFTNRKPDAPSLTKLFDNEKTATTTPIFTFVATDAEGEELDYQIQVDDDYAFGSTLIDESTVSNLTDFTNLVVPSDKAPYNQGQEMQFWRQNTALANGTTYWWRVRARDTGSDEWSAWATPRSFTVDTSFIVSAWYQTTEEQFDTNTLVGLETPSADYVSLISGSTTGSITSTAIDFDDGTLGSAWGRFYFDESDSSGVINYQFEYYTDGAVWALIPDSVLSGNSSGFTATTSLLDLDYELYNQIRVIANFTGSGGSPRVNSWTVEWGYRVETPTITKLFPNEKTGTTTPTFEFTTTDPQNDSLTYQISWSTDNTFTSSTTRTSDATPPTGFINSDDGGDTDPFTSGDTIQFTVQPADALTDNTTYWWRVRAKDTTGDDAYSLWTEPQSFTASSSVVVSTWFQTTEEQFNTNILSGTNALASDAVSVATTADEAMIVYGEGTEVTPRYRQWDGSSWSSEGSLASVGAAIKWAVVRAGTQREEYIAGTIGTDADVNVQVFSTGVWSDLQEVTSNVGDVNARGFDIAYETLSGDAMVAYCDGDATPSYYMWDGSSWTSGGGIGLTLSATCEWVRLASDPVSDEIIILARDANGTSYSARVWSGSAWGNTTTHGGITDQDHEGMAIAYEESGGQAVIVTSDGNPARFRYDTWSAGAWTGALTQGLGDDFEWGELISDVGSDELALCYQDEDTNIGMVRWTGSAWAGQTELLTTVGKAKTDPGFSCVFEDGGSRDNYILTAYTDTTQTNYSFWNNVSWSSGTQINSITDTITSKLERTGIGLILGVFFDETNDSLLFSSWNGSNWATTTTLENNASVGTSPYGHPYALAPRNSGKTGTTIVSPGINFSDGTGPYWDNMSWSDTTPGSSDILYSVQYYDGDSWEFIPDGDLPGNSAGTSTSPIDLSGLSKVTYNLIRPYASLSCDGSNNCPTLWDWTVEWAEGISIEGTLQEYDQSTNVGAGTVGVAVNGVLQIGKTGSVSGGAWTISNVTVNAGDIVSVFVSDAATTSEAVGVTRYDGTGNITGLQMYELHVALGSDDATTTPLTNADIALYNAGNDEDVFVDLSGSTLNVCGTEGCFDAELYINASTTFAPGGNVITHDIENNGTLIATTTLYISGSWDNNATTTMTGSTVVFVATSTSETIDATGSISSGFNNVTFGTTTGNATWTPVTALDLTGNLSVTRGTLARGVVPVSLEGNLANGANGFWTGLGTTTFDGGVGATWSDANATLQNVGNVVVDGATKVVTLAGNVAGESITIGADDTLDASGTHFDITVYDDWRNSGTFVARNGEVFFAGTSTGKDIDAGGDPFYDLTFTGTDGGWSFIESTLTVNNDLTIATGTVTMPIATTTLLGSFDASGGTFMHSNAVLYFTATGAETITASGTALYNHFFDMIFEGSGSWSFVDTSATSSHDVTIEQGVVTFPSGIFAIGGSVEDSGGSFIANGGTVELYSTFAETIQAGGSTFNNLLTTGSGSWTFADTNATIAGDLTLSAGTLTLPSGTLTLGGSLLNTATLSHANGVLLFNSADTGETIDLGGSSLYSATFNNTGGGWTITDHATTTNNLTLTDLSDFTLASGQTLSVGGVFTNSVSGASTTWTGSTLSLEGGTYSVNTKTSTGDVYATLAVSSSAHVSLWNSSATVYAVNSAGSLYSQDHAGVDGDLNIYGAYPRTSGTEYWNYATDFDGTDLSGGSERLANVNFANGASASLTNATLQVLGISSASTTISNQGSGTYTVSVTAGTTTARYYDFADLGSTGLSLLSGTIVTSLLDGAYEVDTDAGSAITLSSTTIDANPAKQIYRVSFSTTTAISATNVTQTDGAPVSYWWFRNSSGNLDGEDFDNDEGGDPGSVRWDDSSLVVTIAGTVYTDDGGSALTGATCNGVLEPVTIVVEGGATYTGSCGLFDGSYSIGGVVVVGDPTVTVYLDGAFGGERAVAVTKTPTADVLDMDLYVNRVITRHEDIDALTIADMSAFDSADDADIQFSAATGTQDTLTVFSNNELHVWATTTFTPNGTVILHANATANTYDGTLHIGEGATFTGAGTTTYTIGGSIDMEAGGTFVPASTTVIMSATTTGKTIDTNSLGTLTFNALQFTGAGGGWNINGNISATAGVSVATGTVTGTGDITVSSGSFSGNGLVSLGGGLTTIARTNTLGGTQAWTFNDLTLGSGAVTGTTTPASTATTTVGGVLTIGTAHFLDAGSAQFDLSGSGTVFIENGTYLEDTSTLTYSGTGATNILSTDYYNLVLNSVAGTPTYTATGLGIQVFNDLTIGISGTTNVDFAVNDPALNVDGDLYIGASGTLVASDSGSFTLAGSYDNDGVFTASGGTLIIDGAGTETISAGTSPFSSITLTGSGSFTVAEHATATSAFTIATAVSDFTLASGQILAVGGTFTNGIGGSGTTWSNTTLSLYGGGNYEINASTTADAYDTLLVGANTDIRMWNSIATTTITGVGGSLYSMDHDNVSGDLYIFGDYEKISGTDFWSYATDFDGTNITGGERTVDVYIESSDSVTYRSGGALSILGSASASTTIQNQGSGAYAFTIGNGGSTTMRYYEFTNMDSDGVTFTGAPNVPNISFGRFVIENNNDSGITVGGTAIDANPARTFTNNIFATSSGVTSAVNVTATGTSVSSWRFTNHAGDIDGEEFDDDPDDDPGYVSWDDSAALITVGGAVYSDEGTTVSAVCDGSTTNIVLYVAGNPAGSSSCNGTTGLYSIPDVAYSSGDSLIVYISGETEKAATVSVDPISSINNMDLYENRVIVRHENTNAITIANMAFWDSSDDGDIPFTAVDAGTDTLTLPANRKLIVWTNKEFAPGGNVTLSGGGAGAAYDGTLELFTNGDFTSAPGESHSVGGSLISGTGSVFDASTANFTFTTTGSARTIDTNDAEFANVTFNGTGSWTVTNTIFGTDDLTITQGAVTLPPATTTISGTLNNSGGSFVASGGLMVFDSSSAENITAGGSDFAEVSISGSGSFSMLDTNATTTKSVTVSAGTLSLPSGTLAVGGNFRNEGGALTHNTSELILSTTTTATLLTSGSDLYAVTLNGGGVYSMDDTSLTLLDSLTIASGFANLASGTLSIGGSFDASGGTFNHASGTILFNSSDTGESIDPGVSSFYNVNIAGASGGWTIASHATTTNYFTLGSANSFTMSSGNILTVGGVFTNSVGGSGTTWTGSTLVLNTGLDYSINSKSSGGDDYETLVISANTDIASWNSRATTTTVAPSASLYSRDHGSVDGVLNIYGDYHIATGTRYWSYATDFDGTNLTGGSERAVVVSIASGATTTVDGGTLRMIGASGNETDVTNQGSGTYAFAVESGTFNAQYYSFKNLNATGLSLTGTPVISSLQYGDFELAVSGGSLISLSSTTLNANASLVITGARFATTTAITGTNVNLTGVTSNAWTFVSHTGNLDGEDFDNDGGTACGSIRWNDSACLLTQQTHYRWRNDDGGLGVPASEWFDTNWDARKSVRVDNVDATNYTNAVVELLVIYDSDMQADFDDLRFTDSSGTTTVPHFVASTTNSNRAEVWVQVPSLPASETATLYMYYKNPTATTTSSSTLTFVAADDFEDNSISEYSGETSLFTVAGTFAYGGSYGLDNSSNKTAKAVDGMARFDQTVSQGEIIRYMQYVDTSAGSGDEVCTLFGVQSPVTNHANYAVCLEQVTGTDRLSISENVAFNDTSGTVLASTTVAYTTGWYEVEIDWQTNNSIDVTLSKNGAVVATTSASDSSKTSGGIGFTYWFNHGGWDNYTSRPRVENEPTIRFGAEVADGGATWAAAQNSASAVSAGDTTRLRFAIENSGLAITNQTFDLEYASKGVAPSCEAVSGSNYVTVPPQASCGSSPICMQTTTHYADGAGTADLLMETNGAFIAGRAVESPSNTTANIDIDQDEFTELEYAITPTINASSTAYCLRVTDAGSEVDTYLRVAELTLRFDPSFGAVTFNDGMNITLVGGTTTRVYATSSVSDQNGYADLVLGTSTMYATPGNASCTADNNNCYRTTTGSQCSFTNCAGNSCVLECYADFYYHADPTDLSGDDWYAFLEVEDQQGGYDFATSPGIDLITLASLNVTSAISYGALEVSSTTGSYNPTTTVINIGNNAIDVSLEGTDLTDGGVSAIPTNEQIFATSSFTYSSCVYCTNLSTTTIPNYELDLNKPTSTSTPIQDVIYWGIQIPFGVASNPHQGTNTFYAVSD